jgi:hypothetical protein
MYEPLCLLLHSIPNSPLSITVFGPNIYFSALFLILNACNLSSSLKARDQVSYWYEIFYFIKIFEKEYTEKGFKLKDCSIKMWMVLLVAFKQGS